MLSEFLNQRRRYSAHAVMAKVDKELVGWCLVYPERGRLGMQFWVYPQYRRKGYGSKLYKHAAKRFKKEKFEVYPWDSRSYGFFDEMKTIKPNDY